MCQRVGTLSSLDDTCCSFQQLTMTWFGVVEIILRWLLLMMICVAFWSIIWHWWTVLLVFFFSLSTLISMHVTLNFQSNLLICYSFICSMFFLLLLLFEIFSRIGFFSITFSFNFLSNIFDSHSFNCHLSCFR